MAFQEYLTGEERADLVQAFFDAGIGYDPLTRENLLDGVNRRFVVQFLPIVGADHFNQLTADLLKMNRIERLTDGTVPLAQWLRNAVRRFQVLPQGALFEKALDKVTRTGEPAAPAIDAAQTPSTDFEEIITDGEDDLQDVAFLSAGVQCIPAVVKVLVPRFDQGKQMMLPNGKDPAYGAGTGWLLGSDLLMTNYHVVRHRLQSEAEPSEEDLLLQARGSQAHFFYDADGQEGQKIRVKELVAVGKESTEDFALLRLEKEPGVRFLPISRKKVEIPQSVQTPNGAVVRALAVNIIQHPGGGPKRVALRNNLVYTAEYPRLHYFTDTLRGSSGSPVLDDNWRVVALHRAAVAKTALFHGKKLGYVNEGVQLHAILAALGDLAKENEQVRSALAQIEKEQAVYAAPPA